MYYLINHGEDADADGPIPFASAVLLRLDEIDDEVVETIFVARLLNDASMQVFPAQEWIDSNPTDEDEDDEDAE